MNNKYLFSRSRAHANSGTHLYEHSICCLSEVQGQMVEGVGPGFLTGNSPERGLGAVGES